MTFLMTSENQVLESSTAAHEHVWQLESAHTTSEGRVLYIKCAAECGARRVDLDRVLHTAPAALSREVGA